MHKITLNLSEIVDLVEQSESDEHAVAILKEYWNTRVRDLFLINFDPDYQFLLPPGPIPYKPSGFVVGEAVSLMSEMRVMPMMMSHCGTPMKVCSDARRQALFVQILESLTDKEAELLCKLKDKSVGTEKVNLRVLAEVDPKTFRPLLESSSPMTQI